MDTASQLAQTDLDWRQPVLTKWEFELWAGAARLAVLKWKSPWGMQAAVELAESRWVFDRTGFLKTRVTLRKVGDDCENAVYEPHWSGQGKLIFTDGRHYQWRYTNFWTSTSEWATAEGKTLLTFKLPARFRLRNLAVTEGQVEVIGASLAQSDMLLLAVFGWYLRLLNTIDASAATTTVAATSM